MEQEKGIESEGVIPGKYVAAAVKLFIRGVGELLLTDLSFYLQDGCVEPINQQNPPLSV